MNNKIEILKKYLNKNNLSKYSYVIDLIIKNEVKSHLSKKSAPGPLVSSFGKALRQMAQKKITESEIVYQVSDAVIDDFLDNVFEEYEDCEIEDPDGLIEELLEKGGSFKLSPSIKNLIELSTNIKKLFFKDEDKDFWKIKLNGVRFKVLEEIRKKMEDENIPRGDIEEIDNDDGMMEFAFSQWSAEYNMYRDLFYEYLFEELYSEKKYAAEIEDLVSKYCEKKKYIDINNEISQRDSDFEILSINAKVGRECGVRKFIKDGPNRFKHYNDIMFSGKEKIHIKYNYINIRLEDNVLSPGQNKHVLLGEKIPFTNGMILEEVGIEKINGEKLKCGPGYKYKLDYSDSSLDNSCRPYAIISGEKYIIG